MPLRKSIEQKYQGLALLSALKTRIISLATALYNSDTPSPSPTYDVLSYTLSTPSAPRAPSLDIPHPASRRPLLAPPPRAQWGVALIAYNSRSTPRKWEVVEQRGGLNVIRAMEDILVGLREEMGYLINSMEGERSWSGDLVDSAEGGRKEGGECVESEEEKRVVGIRVESIDSVMDIRREGAKRVVGGLRGEDGAKLELECDLRSGEKAIEGEVKNEEHEMKKAPEAERKHGLNHELEKTPEKEPKHKWKQELEKTAEQAPKHAPMSEEEKAPEGGTKHTLKYKLEKTLEQALERELEKRLEQSLERELDNKPQRQLNNENATEIGEKKNCQDVNEQNEPEGTKEDEHSQHLQQIEKTKPVKGGKEYGIVKEDEQDKESELDVEHGRAVTDNHHLLYFGHNRTLDSMSLPSCSSSQEANQPLLEVSRSRPAREERTRARKVRDLAMLKLIGVGSDGQERTLRTINHIKQRWMQNLEEMKFWNTGWRRAKVLLLLKGAEMDWERNSNL